MEPRAIHDLLAARFGDAITGFEEHRPPFIVVAAASVASIARFLRDEPALGFDALMSLSGVDYGDRMAVAYHLHSLPRRHVVGLKAFLAPDALVLPSVDKVWPCANWHEREAYDLLGIVFEGSSDLRRILLPDDWPGHPLRKDYVYPDSYHGVKV